MKHIIERYVRSLKEREDDPERNQDLGTLLTWILEQLDFTLLERPFKFNAEKLGVSKGRLQHGIDLLAAKRRPDGGIECYRFVLKFGAFGKAQFTPTVEGTLLHDLELAASLPYSEREGKYGIEPKRIHVIAVHNGSLDRTQVGANVTAFLAGLSRYPHVESDWWDAEKLVELVLSANAKRATTDAQPDIAFFPPSVRPFVSLALHSLIPERGPAGAGFDYQAIDRLVDERLPLGGNGASMSSPEGLHRSLVEVSLFAHMLTAECDRVANGTTLPVFDTVERILARAMEQARRFATKPLREFQRDIEALTELYLEVARRLLNKLRPLLGLHAGLALPHAGEAVSYPLRTLRLSGYLATAALALVFRGNKNAADRDADIDQAKRIAEALVELWQHNPGGVLNPMTDDQVIEIGLTWEVWLRLGMADSVRLFAERTVEQLALRRAMGLPLPSLWHRSRIPQNDQDIAAIVEAHVRGVDDAPDSFEQGASTILPVAAYLAQALGGFEQPELLTVFEQDGGGAGHAPVFAEVWLPPFEAPSSWYFEGIEHAGTCKVVPLDDLATTFELPASSVQESYAAAVGFVVVDRMAWKLFRTPFPPEQFGVLIRLTKK